MAKAKLAQKSAREFIWEIADDAGALLVQVNFLHVTDETEDGSPSWRATLYPPSLAGGLHPHVWGGAVGRLDAFRDAMTNYLGASAKNAREFPVRNWEEIEAALLNERAFGP